MNSTTSKEIPIRKVILNNLSELPNDCASTPGGTLFSTTPGGTRIIYDRSFLLKCRSSPLANTPPSNLPDIPGITSPEKNLTKGDGKINEEIELQMGKENGGRIHQGAILPSPYLNPAYGFDVYGNTKSPLQQYRQRSFIQQNSAFFEKACQEASSEPPPPPSSSAFINRNPGILPSPACNSLIAMQQPACVSASNGYVGDGAWQDTFDVVSVPAVRKACPTSQLSLWRQNKLNHSNAQAPQVQVNSTAQVPQNNVFSPGHPGLSIYRGVGRGYSQGVWPGSLCDPLEKLFKVHAGNGFFPGQSMAYNNYTPAYGQYEYSREVGMQYDNASIMQ